MKRIINILPDILGIFIVLSIFAVSLYKTSADNYNPPSELIIVIDGAKTAEGPQEPILECLGEFKITAYCSCEICCEHYAANRPLDNDGNKIIYGAACVELKEGISVAADTSILPFGTEIVIDGHRYTVQDRGGSIRGKCIDIYFSDHKAASAFGVQYKNVYIERTIENEQEKKNDNQIYSSYRNCNN